jgi:hypothetical protein
MNWIRIKSLTFFNNSLPRGSGYLCSLYLNLLFAEVCGRGGATILVCVVRGCAGSGVAAVGLFQCRSSLRRRRAWASPVGWRHASGRSDVATVSSFRRLSEKALCFLCMLADFIWITWKKNSLNILISFKILVTIHMLPCMYFFCIKGHEYKLYCKSWFEYLCFMYKVLCLLS